MLVSVVIPTHNGRGRLAECLGAVFEAAGECRGDKVEIIVVDDASTDGTAEWCRGNWKAVHLVEDAANKGFAGAANAGIAAAGGEWVALLNDDAVAERGWISGARLDEQDSRVGAVASRIMKLGQADTIESCGDGYTVAGLAYHRQTTGPGQGGAGGAGAVRVFSACAAAAFYRREALEQAGGFEERFESHYEDVDLGFRLNLLGWRTVYEGESACRHRSASSYGELSFKKIRNSARNSETVFFSCVPARLLFVYVWPHLAAVAAQAVLRIRQGGLIAFAAGKADFVTSLGFVINRRRRIQKTRSRPDGELRKMIDANWVRLHILDRARAGSRPRLAK